MTSTASAGGPRPAASPGRGSRRQSSPQITGLDQWPGAHEENQVLTAGAATAAAQPGAAKFPPAMARPTAAPAQQPRSPAYIPGKVLTRCPTGRQSPTW
jgi:hypothetical protein